MAGQTPGRVDVYRLDTGDSFSVAPDRGCNLFSWVAGGTEVLYRPAGFPAGPLSEKGGNPLLFPAVGRTWDTSPGGPYPERYRIHGREEPLRMPCHGIADRAAWTRTEVRQDAESVTAEYLCLVPEDVRRGSYPFDVVFRQAYTLRPDKLLLESSFENAGRLPAPLAFGTHPYFAFDRRAEGGLEVELPACREVELNPGLLVPTGKSRPVPALLELPPDGDCDTVFVSLQGRRASLRERLSGRSVSLEFDSSIEMLVLYSPHDSGFVCLEPWTRGLGAYADLADAGWEERAALMVLQPGEIRRIRISLTIEPL